MKEQNTLKLGYIIRTVLEMPTNEDPRTARKLTNKRWDSLAQVSMIAAIESEFKIKISTKDYERFSSFKSIELLLTEHGL